MNKLLQTLDGSGQVPRDIQVHYFTHLEAQMATTRIHGMSGPPGVGKSYIARTIQRTYPGAAIITPNNLLVDQYVDTYPELNALKGKDYYESDGFYYRARKAARDGTPTIYNPLSFYYFHIRNPKMAKPSVVVIDEAHSLGDMLLLTVTRALNCKYFGIPKDLTDTDFVTWLEGKLGKLETVYKNVGVKPSKAVETVATHYETFKILHEYLLTHLQEVKIGYEERADHKGRLQHYLTIQPLTIPVDLITTIFGKSTQLILLSGSLTTFHLQELFPKVDNIDFINYEPLAPKENRPIFYDPVPREKRTCPQYLAKEIERIYRQDNMTNTIVHVSYKMAKQLLPYLKHLNPITHVKADKQDKLAEFKFKGGLLLAAGMAEGVDLPGDLCRLIIIPRLLFPNLGDQAVKKRMALPGGQTWYELNTIMTTVQQIGRGVRSATDSCKTVVLDPLFPRTVRSNAKYLTKGFQQSIQWHKG